ARRPGARCRTRSSPAERRTPSGSPGSAPPRRGWDPGVLRCGPPSPPGTHGSPPPAPGAAAATAHADQQETATAPIRSCRTLPRDAADIPSYVRRDSGVGGMAMIGHPGGTLGIQLLQELIGMPGELLDPGLLPVDPPEVAAQRVPVLHHEQHPLARGDVQLPLQLVPI